MAEERSFMARRARIALGPISEPSDNPFLEKSNDPREKSVATTFDPGQSHDVWSFNLYGKGVKSNF